MMVLAGAFGYVGIGSVMCAFATFCFLVYFFLAFIFYFYLFSVGGRTVQVDDDDDDRKILGPPGRTCPAGKI